MTQLMMWKRNGVEECGVESPYVASDLWYFNSGGELRRCPKSSVIDLQLAEVVPIDSIVISKELWESGSKELAENFLENKTDEIYGVIRERDWWVKYILAENPHLTTPEPMKEPTNFGAVVEAESRNTQFPGRVYWTFDGTIWAHNRNGREWHQLIHPVLKGEGVVRK